MKKVISVFIIATGVLFTSCGQTAKEQSAETTVTETMNNESNDINKTEGDKKMGTIKMTKTDFLTKVHNYEENMETWKYLGDKPAVIDFYADWCGPCKQIAPILEELAGEYADEIYIYKVDVDSEQELAAMFGIRSIPSMLFIPMDGQPQMASGAAPKTELKQTIDKVLLNK